MPDRETDSMKTKPKVVVTFGVFDLLHPGHVAFLQEARRHGDKLIVVVTRDERAELEKGRRPYYGLEERIGMLNALECVDEAVSGDEVGEWTMLRRLSPQVICIGHDQRADHPKIVEQMNGLAARPEIVRVPAFGRERYSTSELCRKLGI